MKIKKISKKRKKLASKIKKVSTKIKRVSTGIKELDKLIEGGVKNKSINLVVGGAGSGKTILSVQFLVDGLKRGENVIYITFEERKEDFFENMLMFGWDLAKYEKNGKFIFVEYAPEKIKEIVSEGGGVIENLIVKKKAKRLVIDSISSFTLLYKDELAKKEASLALFDLIRSWGCTAMLAAEDESPELSEIVSAGLEFEVDGIILLYHVKKKGKRIRGLEVLKMRGTKHTAKTFPIEIGKEGIKINTKKAISF